MIDISVIIPVYDRPEKVLKAIRSVCEQTYPAKEIIVVDDGSTDNTVASVKKDFPQVKVIAQKHQGVSSARNKGVAGSNCKWLAFLDSDDIWHKDKLEKQVNFIKENPGTLILQTDEIWIRNGKRVNPMKKHQKYSGLIFKECLPRCIVTPSSVLMRKDLFNTVGGFDEKLPACEDYDLWLRIAKDIPIELINEHLLTRYGGHDDQLSAKYGLMDSFRISALEKVLKTKLKTEQKILVKNEIKKKAKIIAGGALKRKNIRRYLKYIFKAKAML
jgi:glycosyltransferase involved in cell wall biosynthesis